jgi:hypothetical protein
MNGPIDGSWIGVVGVRHSPPPDGFSFQSVEPASSARCLRFMTLTLAGLFVANNSDGLHSDVYSPEHEIPSGQTRKVSIHFHVNLHLQLPGKPLMRVKFAVTVSLQKNIVCLPYGFLSTRWVCDDTGRMSTKPKKWALAPGRPPHRQNHLALPAREAALH